MHHLLLLLVIPALAGCWPDRMTIVRAAGATMGTTYHITIIDPPEEMESDALQTLARTTLFDVNAIMSNWEPESEIMRFNDSSSTEPVAISTDLSTVLVAADEVNALSGGKFDITLAPLIDLWGFGAKASGAPVPSDAEIAQAQADIGQADLLELSETTLRKRRPNVSINLSAIAKGYGIDRVATALTEAGVERYLVEVGGDLVARGANADGDPWSIGIETPDIDSRALEMIVALKDHGLATSGDYRNYFEKDGVRYSHIIDPTTGRPVTHKTASVTVVAQTAMAADALATALLVVGGDEAISIANANDIAVFVIRRDGGGFVTSQSRAFSMLVDDNQ